MSGRKTPKSKSNKKHQQIIQPQLSLTQILMQRALKETQPVQSINLGAAVLQSIISDDRNTLRGLLQQNSGDLEAVRNVVRNMIESKVPIFIDILTQLLEQNSNTFVYPWLKELISAHPRHLNPQIAQKLGYKLQQRQKQQHLKQLLKLQGKLALIQYQ